MAGSGRINKGEKLLHKSLQHVCEELAGMKHLLALVLLKADMGSRYQKSAYEVSEQIVGELKRRADVQTGRQKKRAKNGCRLGDESLLVNIAFSQARFGSCGHGYKKGDHAVRCCFPRTPHPVFATPI